MALLNYWRERRNRLSTMTRRLFSNIPCNTFCAPPRFSASRFFPPFFLRGGGVSTAAGSRRRRFYHSIDAVADKTRPWCPGRPLRYCLWYRRMEEKRHWSAVRRDGVETKTKVEPKRTDGRTVGKRGGDTPVMELPGLSVFVGTHVKQPGRLAGQGESLMTCAQMALWLFLHCQWFIEVRPSVRWDHNFSPFCCLLIDDGRQTTAIRFSANERVRFIDRSSSYRVQNGGKKKKTKKRIQKWIHNFSG